MSDNEQEPQVPPEKYAQKTVDSTARSTVEAAGEGANESTAGGKAESTVESTAEGTAATDAGETASASPQDPVVPETGDAAPASPEEADDGEGKGAAALAAELEQAREQVLRAQAEVQNTRRRAEQDVDRARKYALERFCGELLPVVDNLERALESASGDDEQVRPIAEGVELTLKSFLNALGKFNIEPVDPAGEPFDPQYHQAMSSVENPDVEPNTVVAVMQKGYTLNGRLVRPAMVMVSKAAAGDGGA